jgi:hypothetical protein
VLQVLLHLKELLQLLHLLQSRLQHVQLCRLMIYRRVE